MNLKLIINRININVNYIINKFFINNKIEYQKILSLEKIIKNKELLHKYGFDYNNDRIIYI
jgi:hypothetical protein